MPRSKKETKRLYDIQYRKKNPEKIKQQKAEYYQTPAGRATQKRNREKLKESHLEYCRRPEQKLKTKLRDQKRQHGEYRECYEIMEEIFSIIRNHFESGYERRKARGYYENRFKHRRS